VREPGSLKNSANTANKIIIMVKPINIRLICFSVMA
jgi:hypothetical protein